MLPAATAASVARQTAGGGWQELRTLNSLSNKSALRYCYLPVLHPRPLDARNPPPPPIGPHCPSLLFPVPFPMRARLTLCSSVHLWLCDARSVNLCFASQTFSFDKLPQSGDKSRINSWLWWNREVEDRRSYRKSENSTHHHWYCIIHLTARWWSHAVG